MSYIPDDPALQRYFADEAEIREKYWKPRPGESVFDIGCGPGSYALAALEAGASVVAIDCNSLPLEQLSAIIATHFPNADIELLNCAIGDERTPYDHVPEYMRPPSGTLWIGLDDLVFDNFGSTVDVDWIKIDVEGGELAVLESADETLSLFHPRLFIEDHTTVYEWVKEADVAGDIEATLRFYGYSWDKIPYTGADGYREYWITT